MNRMNTASLSDLTPISDVLFTVVDCETTGFSAQFNRVIQLGAVVVSGTGAVHGQFDTIVRPESPSTYKHDAEHIHGISAEQVQNGIPLERALADLHMFGAGNLFVAHNAPFDIGFLRAEAQRVSLSHLYDPWFSQYIDTVGVSRRLDPDRTRSHKLGTLCEHYDLLHDNAHNALADAQAAARLLVRLFADLGITRFGQLAELLDS